MLLLLPVIIRGGGGGGKMAGVAQKVYNALFRRTSTFAATIMLGAFCFERTFDVTSEYIFDSINRGVRLLWHCVSNDRKRNYL